MKRNLLITVFLLLTITCCSQSKSIVGSWLWRDSINAIQFFVNSNGTIEKRTSLANEYVWGKTPQIGTYKFKKEHSLVIKWATGSIEIIEVKFINKNAEFWFSERKANPNKPFLFVRIVDEEIIPDK